MINWIKIEDKQPPIGLYVLTYTDQSLGLVIQSAKLEYDKTDGALRWDSGNYYNDVTYWAYITDLP